MAHPAFWPSKFFFYPIGNTSPICLTQSLAPEQDAQILLLGCGDARNVLYTIYASGADRDDSTRNIEITCNDIEPAILARNILLYTLILDDGYPQNAPLLWNIFYHYFLDDAALALLVSQSGKLSRLSADMDTWNASGYSPFLRISSRFTLFELNRLWTLYAATASFSQAKKKQMRQTFVARMKEVARDMKDMMDMLGSRSAGPVFIHAFQRTTDAYHFFWQKGVTFDSQDDVARATHANPTFAYASQGDGFPTHYATSPLPPFHLAPSFTPVDAQTRSRGASPTIFDLFRDVKAQFRLWCDATRSCFTKSTRTLCLSFLVGDVLAVCQTLQTYTSDGRIAAGQYLTPWDPRPLLLDGAAHDGSGPEPDCRRFDVIDTSNLSDHMGMLNILVATIPLLRRHPSATLLTETLLSVGDDPLKSFATRICGDPNTIFTLLDLVPSSYVSGFTTQSNAHEVMYHSSIVEKKPERTQHQERMIWKFLSLDDSVPSTVSAEPSHISAILFDIYTRMFVHENSATLFQGLSRAKITDRSLVHYCRRSLVLLIQYLMTRIAVDWRKVIDLFISRIASSATLLSVSMNYYQDLLCHLHRLGLRSEDSWAPNGPLVLKNKDVGRFRSWTTVPSVVCVALSVPREKLRILDSQQAQVNALLQCGIWGPTFQNAFTYFQSAFGTISTSGEGEDTRIVVTVDPKGKQGSSDFIVAVWVPTWILGHLPSVTQITLEVVSTPATAPLSLQLGLNLRLYGAPLMDSQRVFISASSPRYFPTVEPVIPSMIPPKVQLRATPLTPAIDVDASSLRVVSMKVRVDLTEPKVKTALANRATPVNATPGNEPGIVILSIGDAFQQPLRFSPLADTSAPKLKVARSSSWVEVLLSVPQSGTRFLRDFPLLRRDNIWSAWNVHYTNLDRLPALRTSDPKRLDWLDSHTALAFSDRERQQRKLGTGMSGFTQSKDSLHAMTMHVSGVQVKETRQVLALDRTSDGGIDTLFFVTHLRLDLPAHTIVFDAFVLCLEESILPRLGQYLGKLSGSGSMVSIVVSTEELVVWKRWLPALVERCRSWEHKPDCAYLRIGAKVPLSVEHGGRPICSCGQGIVTDAFRAKKAWQPFTPYVTRVAISPLFSLSYLETVAGPFPEAFKSGLLDKEGASSSKSGRPQCSKCRKALPVGKVSVCSACKSASYCSRECQVADWRQHKVVCRK